jgi:LPXTG-motif cell wall-anchored protein
VSVRSAGIAVLTALMALATPASTRPAFAHHGSGGPVGLYLGSVRLEPQGDGWVVRAVLNDTSSGTPAPGYLVQVTGSGPQGATFGPVSLSDDHADGRYDASLGRLAPGNWSVSVDVGDAPGGDGYLVPISKTWPVRLHPGQAVDLVGRGSARSSGSGTDFTPLLLVVGVVALLGLSAAWLSRRRRAMVPARFSARGG